MKLYAVIALILCIAFNSFAKETDSQSSSAASAFQYDLSIKILPDTGRAEVAGTMLLPPAAAERDTVKFLLWSRIQNLSVQIIEPETVVPLLELSNDNADGDRTWTVKPSKPFPANQPILLQFLYVTDGKSYPQFTISPESSYVGGGGELWYPQTSFKEREIGILKFTVPAGETVISNGAGVSTAAQKARGEFVFRVTKPVKFGFAAGKYLTFRHAGKIPITLYLLKSRDTARNIVNISTKALNFLTQLNGKFPYPEFSLVEVDFRGRLAGTGEFGFILADKKEFEVFNFAYWAHEIGHQWWGDIVRSKSGEFGQMMFSEGMTQFSSFLAVESIEGEKAAEDFRRFGYRGFRKNDSAKGYFELISSGTDFPLTLYKPKDQNETLLMHRLANSKGFILMDMLSRRIGRAKLAAILKRFISRHSEQLTSWQELQQTIEKEAGQDVRWFFEQWFERTGAPDYQLEWKQEGKIVRGAISQPAPYFRAALEVEIKGANKRRLLKTVEVLDGQTQFNWSVPFKVDSVVLDPRYKVLRWLPEFKVNTEGGASRQVEIEEKAKAEQTTIVGKLLGHDGNPMLKADVHLLRFNQSKPLVSVPAAEDGSFKIETTESGLFTVQFTGVNHKSRETVLLIEKPVEVNLNAKLESYDYAKDFNDAKIIGDFNDFSFNSAVPMEKQPDGTYAAEFAAKGGKFAYQLLGLTTSGGSINGTQSENYVYDGGGDYRSIVTPVGGRVKIVFDPKLLARSKTPSQIAFLDANSIAARFASIYEAVTRRRKSLQNAVSAYKKTGKPLEQFRYNWSAERTTLSKQIVRERSSFLRQALLIAYLDLGYGTFGAELDSDLARKAFAEIPATSPLWSIEPRLLGVALSNSGQAESFASYVEKIVENHPDSTVKRIVKAEYAPTRNIMVGKDVPPFSLVSLTEPQTVFTSENLKGKTVLIDFWATWCVPCMEEVPNLHKQYEKFKDKNFEILSVSLDEQADTVQKFRAQKWKMPWLHALMSSSKDVQRQFEIVGIPKAVLIDAAGKIIATEKDLRGKNLDETLSKLSGQTPAR